MSNYTLPEPDTVNYISQSGIKYPLYLGKRLQAAFAAGQQEAAARIAELERDAARYRWLCEDHSDAGNRIKVQELLEHFSVRSYSANNAAIDAAMKEREK